MKDQWFVSCEDMADKAVEVGAFHFVYLNYFHTQNIVSVGYEFFLRVRYICTDSYSNCHSQVNKG